MSFQRLECVGVTASVAGLVQLPCYELASQRRSHRLAQTLL